MREHQTATDEIRERASLFAAGALPPGDAAEFREHMKGCIVCADEARTFHDMASLLPFAVTGPAPPPQLREKLLARIQEPAPPPGISVVRAGDGDWKPLVPGVVAKRLYQESATGSVALLVRMEPGAKYPPHAHADVEHCFVLEGDLRFGDLVLRPGDYQCARAATDHRESHTVNGCMVLIIASQQNTMRPWTL
ncbi:MAG TPA: cupin domain-containing protein [Bryobacteraceae bacterium]|nr:cupin domain-containing protein [Bryobacteraceae bacterium]